MLNRFETIKNIFTILCVSFLDTRTGWHREMRMQILYVLIELINWLSEPVFYSFLFSQHCQGLDDPRLKIFHCNYYSKLYDWLQSVEHIFGIIYWLVLWTQSSNLLKRSDSKEWLLLNWRDRYCLSELSWIRQEEWFKDLFTE